MLRAALCIAAVELSNGLQVQPGGMASASVVHSARVTAPPNMFFFKESAEKKAAKEREVRVAACEAHALLESRGAAHDIDARSNSRLQWQEIKKMQQKRRDPIEMERETQKRRNIELATRAAQEGNLPDGWGSALDPESGERYFYDLETKTPVWDPPIDEMVAILEAKQKAEMEELIEKAKLEQAQAE